MHSPKSIDLVALAWTAAATCPRLFFLHHSEIQFASYLRSREEQNGERYVGVLTDGGTWVTFHLHDG
jgi:hypothetical protein